VGHRFGVVGEAFARLCCSVPAKVEALYGKDAAVDQREGWEINREMVARVAWKPYMFNQALPILLGSVDTPTLVVWGTEDKVVPMSCAQRYVASLRTARLAVLDGCGHCIDVEKPQELAALITAFLGGA